MIQPSRFQAQPVQNGPIGMRMLQGAGIAFIFISMFLLSTGLEGEAAWPKLWFIKPLLLVPMAGALGGIYYYFLDHMRNQGGWRTTLAIVLSLLGYIVVVWLGVVLGLSGTMWD